MTTAAATTAAAAKAPFSKCEASLPKDEPSMQEWEEWTNTLEVANQPLQRFRSNGEVIRIPVRNGPQEGEHFIVWSDLKQCFPGIVRVQFGDIYIPFRRDDLHYRYRDSIHLYVAHVCVSVFGNASPDLKPHNNPGSNRMVILDVTYSTPKKNKSRPAVPPANLPTAHQPNGPSSSTTLHQVNNKDRVPVQHGNDTDRSYLQTVEDLAADIRRRLSTATAAMAATTAIIEAAGLPAGQNHTAAPEISSTSPNGMRDLMEPDDSALTTINESSGELDLSNSSCHSIPEKSMAIVRSTITGPDRDFEESEDTATSDVSPAETNVERPRDGSPTHPLLESIQDIAEEIPVNDEELASFLARDEAPGSVAKSMADLSLDQASQDATPSWSTTTSQKDEPGSEYESATHSPELEVSILPATLQRNWKAPPTIADAYTQDTHLTDVQHSTQHLEQHQQQQLQQRPQQQFLNISHVVSQRMRKILLTRYTWIESEFPKLFIMLPIKRHRAFVDFRINGDDADFDAMSFQDFRIYFLCDCGQIPGYEEQCYPHLEEYDSQSYMIQPTAAIQDTVYLNYMMGVLEMFKFGVVLDGVNHVPKLENQPEMMEMIDCSINFLLFCGIQSSLHIYPTLIHDDGTFDGLSKVVPIELPTPTQMDKFWRHCLVDTRPPLGRLRPYLTKTGDTRRLCWMHWDLISPTGAISMIQQFSTEMTSGRNYYDPHLGAFRGFLQTREQANLYFRVADLLTMLPVLSFYLDWELTAADDLLLQQFIKRTTASAVQVFLQPQPVTLQLHSKGAASGIGHSRVDLVQTGINNSRMLGYMVETRNPVENHFMGNEYHSFSRSGGPSSTKKCLVHYRREPSTNKMDLTMLVTDTDKAALWVHRILQGFDSLSTLRLEVESIWERTHITFSPAASDNHAGRISIAATNSKDALQRKDGNLEANAREANNSFSTTTTKHTTSTTTATTVSVIKPHTDICQIFIDRGCQDKIDIHSAYLRETVLLQSGCVHELMFGHSSSQQDVMRIREALKSNCRKLERLELSISKNEDPCQIYETFKALLANCANLKAFKITHRHSKSNGSSVYIWTGLASGDRSTLKLDITTFAGDKIGPLLQKMASCLQSLTIHGMEPTEAAILEKVLRLKKGPFKLKDLVLWDITKIPEVSLEDIKRIILRYPGFDRFTVIFDSAAKESKSTIGRAIDFLLATAHRVTSLSVYGKGAKLVLTELEKRYVEYVEATKNKTSLEHLPIVAWPKLKSLMISGGEQGNQNSPGIVFTDQGGPLFLRALLRHRFGFMKTLHMTDMLMPDSVWKVLLKDTISVPALVDVRFFQTNPMTAEVLDLIVSAFPTGIKERSRLSISIEEKGGLTVDQISRAQGVFERRVRGDDFECHPIMINGYLG
ncbi:hypothetical protein BG004_000874 [Podila humilis]|nr:hypothetical protein BG004_000874 [Podila humilis]